ncbi:MAG: PBP1A family penicillin-binding protein, partial [Pseudomonadota bacterium]|nr:PBP1A family penicillin-binding protein [Pseudomonadota bacterium]
MTDATAPQALETGRAGGDSPFARNTGQFITRLWSALVAMMSSLRHLPRQIRQLPARRKLLYGATAGVLALLLVAFTILSVRLPLSRALDPLPEPAFTFISADGIEFARRGALKSTPVTVGELPPHVIGALLSMEDRRFYYHFGIDPVGVARATWRNMTSGEIEQGGSTITQQLAKFTFLSSEQTFRRKWQEALISVWLELNLTKDEILERYLSSAYFGDGVYGLRAAARHYFEKPVTELTVAESAMLVGMLKAPSRLTPTRNLKGAQERAALVIDAMVDEGKLDAATAKDIKPARPAAARSQPRIGSWFADWLVDSPLQETAAAYGEVKVRTTLDTRLQKIAEQTVASILGKQGAAMGASQAALVAMRPDGSVVAMVGGRDYGESQYNRAAQAQRQPGSAFKFFVYLAAFRDGATPYTPVVDEDISVEGWRPQNYDRRHYGQMSFEQAFATSNNTAAVVVSEVTGRDKVIRAARDLGISTELRNSPSLALGASEVSLLELTAAYAAVAAGRYPVRPTGISDRPWQTQRSMPETEAMRALLRGVVSHGTGRGARLGVATYGKTGTSQDYKDAWFVGYAGDLVVGVWVGNDDSKPMKGVTGGSLPASIWRNYMASVLKSEPQAIAGLEQPAPPAEPERARQGG